MFANTAVSIRLFPNTQITEFDSSTAQKSYRVELPSGKHFQINQTLYRLLECLNEPMTLATLGAKFQERTGASIEMKELTALSEQLAEQGVIVDADAIDSDNAVDESSKPEPENFSYMGLHWRRDLISAEVLAPVSRFARVLFNRPIAVVGLAFSIFIHVLAYRELGYPSPEVVAQVSWPLLFVLFLLFALVHEVGHLAACQRWNCSHGPLGVGLYFLQPVFYVDVTSSWRLSRKQRAVVDLGGVYFEMLFLPIFWAFYLLTQDTTWLMAIFFTDMMLLSNFEPFMKLDGYWLLSDVTGVPNLHTRVWEMIKRGLAWARWKIGLGAAPAAESAFSKWTPNVQAIIWSYVFLSIAIWPVLIVAMLPVIVTVFSELPAMWQAALGDIVSAAASGDLRAIFGELQILFLPTLALANLLFLLKRTVGKLRTWFANRQQRLVTAGEAA